MDAPAPTAESLHQGALARIEEGDLEGAHALLTDVVRLAPDSLAAHSSLVRVSQQLGRLTEAKAHCERMVELTPDDPSLVLWLGWLNFELESFDEAKSCAAYVEGAAPGRSPDALRLLIFACGKSGDWHRAAIAFEKLSALHSDGVDAIVEAAFGAFADYLLKSYHAGAFADVVNLGRQMPSQFASAKRENIDQVAFAVSDSCLRLGQYGEAIRALEDRVPATGAPRLSKPVLASARSLCFVTSLMPSRLAIQKRAVASWLELGAQVISLNAPHERTTLEGAFPGVRFVMAQRHAEDRFGKPYVYVHDMMTVLADVPSRAVGLINADIVLSPKAGPLLDRVLVETRTTLVCGHRYNVDTIDRADTPDSGASIYEGGYDWFLFSPESAATYMDAPFIFGGPWWDIWMPACALSRRIAVSTVRDPVAFHESHEQRWNEAMYRELGHDFIRTMTAKSRPGEGRFHMRLSELLGTAHALFGNDRPSAQELSWLSPLIRSLIALDSRVL